MVCPFEMLGSWIVCRWRGKDGGLIDVSTDV